MALVAIAGGPGAPGTTTTALAALLAWPLTPQRRVLLAECDPDGGQVLPGALQGRVDGAYGLRNVAVADRRGLLAQSVWEQLIDLSEDETAGRLLLPGVTDPAQAPGLAYTWESLARLFTSWEASGIDVLADLGRSGARTGPAPLARQADAVLLVVRGTLRSLSAARPRVSALREDLKQRGTGEDALGLVLVGEGPYRASDVARNLGVPVVATLPYAPQAAAVLSDGQGESSDRRFARSELMRSARSLTDQVRTVVAGRRRRLGQPRHPAAPSPLPPAPAQVPAYGPGQVQSQVPDQSQSQEQGQEWATTARMTHEGVSHAR